MEPWREIHEFWFPAGIDQDFTSLSQQMEWWFHGGCVKDVKKDYRKVLESAIEGELDDWAESPTGRLMLIIVLDQYARIIHKGKKEAFKKDKHALVHTLEGIENTHYQMLYTPWEKMFFILPLAHAEGPHHIARIERSVTLMDGIIQDIPPRLMTPYLVVKQDLIKQREMIEKFDRFPDRNTVLERNPMEEEIDYLADLALLQKGYVRD